jgi:hypothetical protein
MDKAMLNKLQSFRGEMKKSRFKIWLRAFLFVLFSTIFSIYFVRDISNGYFSWGWVALVFVLFIPVGFWMSRLVPMQANQEESAVTLSFDLVYFVLIWVLVIAKLIMGHIPSLIVVADVIMCAIMGIMFGRLGGIGLRVRRLKLQHGFI